METGRMAAGALLFLLLHLAPGCRSTSPGEPPMPAVPADTSENRRAAAEQVVSAYPHDEFARDLKRRIAEITGPEVLAEVQARVAAELRPEQIRALRVKLYAAYFTPRQLELLRDLYATGDGRVILNNMRRLDEELRDRLKPLVLEVLSGHGSG